MNKVLKHTLALVFCIGFAVQSFAQRPDHDDHDRKGGKEKRERIEMLRVAFITEELSLTTEEAQQFWPLFNGMKDDQKKIRKNLKATRDEAEAATTEAQLLKVMDRHDELRLQEINTQAAFNKKALDLLGLEKTKKLLDVERKFKKEVMREVDRRKENGPRGQGKPGGLEERR